VSRVFLASRNPKKLTELRRILAVSIPNIAVVGLDDVVAYDEPAETEATFEGNALLKARAAAAATGLPSIADDSGICIDALNGMPGVLSARWAGRAKDDAANNALVLDQMHDVPAQRRGAHFRCSAVLVTPTGEEYVASGVLDGAVISEQRGSNGFGYDVIFVPAGERRTTAEMSDDEKDAISHRGKALRALAARVAEACERGAGGS
jgi:XTP/dITP diphosphohydrolase